MDETLLHLNGPNSLDEIELLGKNTTQIFEAMLLLHRYSFRQFPHDISRASLILLDFAPLKENMAFCYLYFILACRSLDIFERTTEIGHLDRAIALLEDFWDEQKSLAVGLILCRACMLHYLVSSEPRACESAINVFQEIRRILPSSVPPSSTKTLMILGDVLRNFCISEQNINETFFSTIMSIMDSIKFTPREFTAFQALVTSLMFEILRREHGTWQQSLADLYVVVTSTEFVLKNPAQINNILDSLDPSMSFATPLCLFYVSDVLDAQGFTLHSDSDVCNSSDLWASQCKEAIQYLRNTLVSGRVNTTFVPFTLKGYPQQRPNLWVERYIQTNGDPCHICIFKFSVLTESQDGVPFRKFDRKLILTGT